MKQCDTLDYGLKVLSVCIEPSCFETTSSLASLTTAEREKESYAQEAANNVVLEIVVQVFGSALERISFDRV